MELRNDVADIEIPCSRGLRVASCLLKGLSSADFNPTLGSASGARQVERLTVLSPVSASALRSIPFPGACYFDKDIKKPQL